MAKPSKTHRFDDDDDRSGEAQSRSGDEEDADTTLLVEVDHDRDDADDERRESPFTFASVSSLPESAFETDYERGVMRKPYTPPMIRPSFRRPESVRRLQMSSPAPSERSSLRPSVFSPSRARTPRSARSSVKGSLRQRQKWVEDEREEDKRDYPLVLLHLTLMPVELRWSRQSMEELLPTDTLESLQLLKSKISSTVLQRGILIPHPKDEYEVLEERLLEALELRKERVTRCGHFHARESTSSSSSVDSGVGSSVEGLDDDDSCATCHHQLRTVHSAVKTGGRKWSIKVFAANGLMRASAWTAAWADMERVDVEILPWIDEELRKALDVRALEKAAVEHARQEEEARRMTEAKVQSRIEEERGAAGDIPTSNGTTPDEEPIIRKADDLPQVYRPKDIPLSLLLQNYIFLLAQDKRNVIIFGLALLALFVSLRASRVLGTNPALPPVCENTQAQPSVLQHMVQHFQSSSPNSAASAGVEQQIKALLEFTTATAAEVFATTPSLISTVPQVAAAAEDVAPNTSEVKGDEIIPLGVLLLQTEAVAEHESYIMKEPDDVNSGHQCRNAASETHLFAVISIKKV